ncbi:MAG TPA: PTS fructose transporter subunit IIA [Deltaproteobacteria bacterium]|jgi:PTS system nitrogen regulatory IIA component|nr:PTS fructose transporter subunit IIA [Deltaproteobacteria bacterium]
MDLSVRDVAKLLNVSEETVYRWVRKGSLPSHRVHDQYRFNRVELQEWAALHKHRVSPDLFRANGSGEECPSLRAAIEHGGVFYGVPGDRREKVLEAVCELPGIPSKVNRRLLYQLLVAREALASTAVGHGIAIPHPRDPVVVRVDKPAVLLCFLSEPVDFHAMDGQAVRVLFTLLSPSVRIHLQLLAKLAFALHDETLMELLRTAAPKRSILERMAALEAEPAPSVRSEASEGETSSHVKTS